MVTNILLKDALLHCKRASFTPQKGIFCNAKDHRLKSNWEITLQQGGRSALLFIYSPTPQDYTTEGLSFPFNPLLTNNFPYTFPLIHYFSYLCAIIYGF